MPKYPVGEFIKSLRNQRGMTQQELAYPNFTRGYISKIERGEVTPQKENIRILLEKLGHDPNLSVEFPLSEKEVKIQSTMDEIENLFKRRKTQEADVLIAQLEEDKEFMKNDLYKQRLLYFKAVSALYKEEEHFKVREFLNEAIKITTPKFKEEDISKYFLTKIDTAIVNAFAIVYGEEGQLDKAVNILYELKKNFESRFIDNESKGRHYPMVIENLVRYLTRAKKYKEAIEVSDIGIKFCIEGSHMRLLPRIIVNKAMCLYEIGGDKEECKKLLRQAYYNYEMRGQFDSMEYIKSYIREKSDIDFL